MKVDCFFVVGSGFYLRPRQHGLTFLKPAKFQSTLPAAPLPLRYGLCNSLSPICQLDFSCSVLSREFPFGSAVTRILLVLSFFQT